MLLREKWKHSHTSNSKACGGAEVMASTNKQTNDKYRTLNGKVSPHHTTQKYVKTTQQVSYYEYCLLISIHIARHIYFWQYEIRCSQSVTKLKTEQGLLQQKILWDVMSPHTISTAVFPCFHAQFSCGLFFWCGESESKGTLNFKRR